MYNISKTSDLKRQILKGGTKLAERRKFFRLPTSIKVSYHRSHSSEKERTSFTKNISLGGIWLIADEELEELDSLALKIFIPGSIKPINAIGEVVWVKEFTKGGLSAGGKFDVGIKFIKIDEKDTKEIEKYISSEAAKQFDKRYL